MRFRPINPSVSRSVRSGCRLPDKRQRSASWEGALVFALRLIQVNEIRGWKENSWTVYSKSTIFYGLFLNALLNQWHESYFLSLHPIISRDGQRNKKCETRRGRDEKRKGWNFSDDRVARSSLTVHFSFLCFQINSNSEFPFFSFCSSLLNALSSFISSCLCFFPLFFICEEKFSSQSEWSLLAFILSKPSVSSFYAFLRAAARSPSCGCVLLCS